MIPARLSSSRLPRKPLFPILGRPLLEWVWKRVESMTALDQAVVATDSREISALCESLGAPVELTSPTHRSGTERVAEVADRPAYRGCEVVVNIQGDAPLVEEAHVRACVDLLRSGRWTLGTCATPLDPGDDENPSTVKVGVGRDGGARWFSRTCREAPPNVTALRHVGLYSYTPQAIAKWVALEPGEDELAESLEQLRPLAAGIPMGVAVVATAGPAVDTLADAGLVETMLPTENRTP